MPDSNSIELGGDQFGSALPSQTPGSQSTDQTFGKAMSLYRAGRLGDAERLYLQLLTVDPNHFGCLYYLGLVRAQQNRFKEAVELFRKALELDPGSADTHVNLAVVFELAGRREQAIEHCDKAIAIKPDCAEAFFTAGNALKALGRLEEALARYEKAIAVNAGHAEAYYNLGNVLFALNRHEQAVDQYGKALAINERYAGALHNRGMALQALRRPAEALQDFDKALAIRPRDLDALIHRGHVLIELKRLDDALASFEKVLSLRPDNAEAWFGRGNLLRELNHYTEAVSNYDRALVIRPGHVDALNNRGYALIELGRLVEALESFERVLTLDPGHSQALGGAARCAARICDWKRTAKFSLELTERAASGRPISASTLLGYCDDPSVLLESAQKIMRHLVPALPPPLWRADIWRNKKIRIAYLSTDYSDGPTAYPMAELFERHDRSRFEILGISLGKNDHSDMRARLVAAFDQFHDLRGKTDRDIAMLLNRMQVDIAVDLSGTNELRPGLLAHRPAPIQVNCSVFPATTGAEFMDYVIADPIVLPFDQQRFYTEKIVHLPESYQVNDSKRVMAADTPTRQEAGLPEQGFVFCSLTNNYKITPQVFDVWMRLLRRIEGSVLWVFPGNAEAEKNLRQETAMRGVDPVRLVCTHQLKPREFLARHRLADLFLDTVPYSAHKIAVDMLWAGLPLLTCRGKSFAGRVAASLLHAAGLPELVMNNLEEYEALALRLATEPSLLAGFRDRLRQNRLTCPLFDTDRFRRHIEAAYITMWEIWQRGESPRSFSVEPHRADA